jgi:hypothetical protein
MISFSTRVALVERGASFVAEHARSELLGSAANEAQRSTSATLARKIKCSSQRASAASLSGWDGTGDNRGTVRNERRSTFGKRNTGHQLLTCYPRMVGSEAVLYSKLETRISRPKQAQ